MSEPATNAILTLASVAKAVATRAAGASGAATGVTLTALEAALVPTLLIARSLTVYVVPLVKPVMVTGDVTEAGLRVVHVDPLLIEYS